MSDGKIIAIEADCFTTKLRRLSRVEMDGIELASRPADYPKFLPMQLVTRCPFMVNIHLGGSSLCFSCRLCFNVSRKKGFGCLFSVEITYFSFFFAEK